MTRSLPIILLCFLLTACGANKNAPKPTQGKIQGTQALIASDAKAGLPVVIQATQEPTALPTIDAEKAQMVADMQAMNDKLEAQRVQLESRAADIASSNAQAAADNLKAVSVQDETAQKQLDREKEITAQKQADADKAASDAIIAKAQTDISKERTNTLTVTVLGVIVICGMLVINRAIKHPVAAQEHPEQEFEEFTPIDTIGVITNHVTGTAQYPAVMQYVIPAHIADAKQLEIIANVFARDGFPLSHNNFTPSWRGFSEGGWKRFQDFLANKTPYGKWIDETDHQRGFNVVDGFKDYLKQYVTDAPRPTLGDEPHTTPSQPTENKIDIDTDTKQTGGGGVEPTFYNPFSPENSKGVLRGYLPEDDKKDGAA